MFSRYPSNIAEMSTRELNMRTDTTVDRLRQEIQGAKADLYDVKYELNNVKLALNALVNLVSKVYSKVSDDDVFVVSDTSSVSAASADSEMSEPEETKAEVKDEVIDLTED